MASAPNRDRILHEGRAVLDSAARCLGQVAASLDDAFVRATETLLACRGMVILTGIGKAGHVAGKVSATLASTGTPSIHLHPSDALHGDLGRVRAQDVVLALSNSGASAELIRLVPPLRSLGTPLVVVTGNDDSPLAREADVCLCYGRHDEAGRLGLAPTTSTTAMLAIGDALAMAVLSQRDFSPAEFALFHPGGALGRSLMRVGEVMRRGDRNPVVGEDRPLFEVLHQMSATPGRPGAASLVDAAGRLSGFYTDGDFRRNMEAAAAAGSLDFLQRPVREFMTRNPVTTAPERLVSEAMRVLRERKIDQVPVVDDAERPVGLLDVQDLLEARILG